LPAPSLLVVNTLVFPTPQDCEAAFYDAFESSDLETMMSVWAEDEDIVCVHPTGPRLVGVDQVRESWRQIFASGQQLRFHIKDQQILRGMLLAVHSVLEHILIAGEPRPRGPVIATNIYLLTERGWRMLAHHASTAPAQESAAVEARPTKLH
jgi:ketosteroid isomerase-like protein